MSSCSFQAQFMSVMELLAKAAVEEIQRHVNDSCAFMRVELNRSRSDVDALKRKCVIMENELRRVKLGRTKRRVWIGGTSDRYPTPIRTGCMRNADVIRSQCEIQEPVLNVHQVVQVLDDEICHPVIKQERDEKEPAADEKDAEKMPVDRKKQNLQHIRPQENIETRRSLSEEPKVQNSSSKPTQTSTELDCFSIKAEHIKEEIGNFTHIDHQRYPHVPEPILDIEPQSSHNTSIFSNHTEPHRKKLQTFERTQIERYQFGAEDSNQSTWYDAGMQDFGHITYRDGLNDGVAYNNESNASYGERGELGAVTVHKLRTQKLSSENLIKRFSCSSCEKSFKRLDQLKEHVRCHTGEKPFTCAQCGHSFTKQSNLIRHSGVHSGEKPFRCARCGKSFTRRCGLKSHQRIHAHDC